MPPTILREKGISGWDDGKGEVVSYRTQSPLPVPWMTHHYYLPFSVASTNEGPWQQSALALDLSAGLLGHRAMPATFCLA